MPRYAFVQMNQAAKTVAFATATTSDESYGILAQDLYNPQGDPLFWGTATSLIIQPGEFCHCTMVGSLEGNKIDIDQTHVTNAITPPSGGNPAVVNIAVGDFLIPDGTGKVAKGSAPSKGWALKVIEITLLTETAFRCQVVNVANAGAVTP